MPLLIWSVIILVAVGGTFVLNRRKRKKFADLAAHLARPGASDASLSGSIASSYVIAPPAVIVSMDSHHSQ